MVNWYSVAVNALWIFGCAVILTAFGYADWLASLRQVRLRQVLSGVGFQASLHGGMVLVCLGLLFTSHRWWEHIVWGLLAALFTGQCYLAWRGRGGRDGSIDSEPISETGDRENMTHLSLLMKSVWRPLVGTLLGAIALYLAFRNVEIGQMRDALVTANYGLVALALVFVLLTLLTTTARWRLLFYPRHQQLRWRHLFAGIVVGQMVNIVIPARLGEVVRSYAVGQNEGVSKMLVLGTIAVEKVMHILVMGLGFAALLPVIAMPLWVEKPGRAVAILGGVATLGVLVLAFFGERIVGRARAVGRRLPGQLGERLIQYGERALMGLGSLRDWRTSLLVWGYSCLVWVLGTTINYIVFRAVGLSLPVTAALFLMVVLQVVEAPPSSPGKIGVFHYLTVLALSAFSVERNLAFSYAVLLHLILYLPRIVLGGIFAAWFGRGLFQAARVVPVADGEGK